VPKARRNCGAAMCESAKRSEKECRRVHDEPPVAVGLGEERKIMPVAQERKPSDRRMPWSKKGIEKVRSLHESKRKDVEATSATSD